MADATSVRWAELLHNHALLGLPSLPEPRTYVGAASGAITTPLAALRAVVPGVEISWDASTAAKFSTKNAKADAERCEVSLCRQAGRPIMWRMRRHVRAAAAKSEAAAVEGGLTV